MTQSALGSSSISTSEDLLVGVCGFVTSLLTAVILWQIELLFGFAFYTWMIWFIIPAGAGLAGFAGASGYYAGSWFFGHRPTPLLLLNIVLASFSTFFMIHYLSYVTLQIEGKNVSDYVPFTQYLDIVIRNTSMEFRFHGTKAGATGELGGYGYIVSLLQVAGFAFGGLAVYRYLTSQPYCEKCHKYLKAKGKQVRYSASPESFTEMVKKLATLFSGDKLQEALDAHGTFGEAKNPKDGYLMSQLERKQCPVCRINWLKFSVQKLAGNEWKEINEMGFAQFHEGELRP